MKIFTENQLEELLKTVRDKGFNEGHSKGVEEGYKKGLHDGLTENKEGVLINGNGIYMFKDKENTEILKG